MATRFVATNECDAHENYKNAYINASKEEIQLVKKPSRYAEEQLEMN